MSRRIRLLPAACLLAVLFFASEQSFAQDFEKLSHHSVDIFIQCLDDAGIYSRERNACSSGEMDRQSRLVERAYQAARGRVSATEKRRLAASQRAWKAGVDRKCRSKDLFGPTLLGTDEIDEVLWCLGDEYMERTEWLERRYLKSKPRHPPAR